MMKLVIENDSQHEINDNEVMGYENTINDDHSPLIINDNNKDNLNEFNDNETAAAAAGGQNLVPCTLCNRKFLANRLEKHLIICQKIKDKKRKLFDAAKQRADNLDKINHYPTEINPAGNAGSESTATTHSNAKTTIKGSKNKRPGRVGDKKENQESNNSSTSKKQSNWRQQHQEFIRTIRAARGAAVSDDNDTSADTGALPAGVVECPTCGRRFSNKAADRHITWCAENVRKQQQKKQEQIHNGNSKNLEALERMKNRTKYKPIPPGSKQQKLQRSRSTSNLNMDHNNNNNRNTKLDTLSVSSNDSNQQRMFGNNKLSKNGQNRNGTKVNTKIKSKSSENLSTKSNNNGGSLLANSNAKSANRIGVLQRKPIPNNRRTININYHNQSQMSKVTSKIDTGINSTNKNHHPNSGGKNGEKTAPIMKFKEKFPNHNHKKTAKSIIDQFQDIEHILRRNSMTTYDDAPKTVPGVRTDGVSPVKNFRNNNNNTPINNNNFHMDNGYELSSLSKSESNLHNLDDNDIKKRIDQYINRLYENETWSNGFMADAAGLNRLNGATSRADLPGYYNDNNDNHYNHHGNHREDRISIHSNVLNGMTRHGSNSSDDARMSTSDSTDSGFGVLVLGQNGLINANGQLETVNERCQIKDGANSKNSVRSFRADLIVSPTLSDIETNNRTLLRNNSLNDIELLNGNAIVSSTTASSMINNNSSSNSSNSISSTHIVLDGKPRFCHQCGTKYPNMMAKFCYECGSRR